MAGYTRRTHIVRIPSPDTPPGTPIEKGDFVDVEVLDAIAFRIENNKEVILSLDATKSIPYIVDNTDGDHSKTPGKATQRSHMKRVKSDDAKNALDIEIVDCWAARDQNNNEWILDMQPGADGSSAYNISDGSGDQKSTRREHNEIVSQPSGKKKQDAKNEYVTSVRSDNIAFRKMNNYEVILSCPSCDDKNADNVDFGRANTFTLPKNYDPTDDSDQAVKPPSLQDSGDQHNYVNFVKDRSTGKMMPIFTQDAKIDMGPFWWIRKISQNNDLWFGFNVTDDLQHPSAYITFDDIPKLAGIRFDLMIGIGPSNNIPSMPDNPAFTDTGGESTTLTSDMLKQTLFTGTDGAKVIGFGLWVFSDEQNPVSEVWINSNSPLFANPFTVTLTTSATLDPTPRNDMIGTPFALSKITSKQIASGNTLFPNTLPGVTPFPGAPNVYNSPTGNDATGPTTDVRAGPTSRSYKFDFTDQANPKITLSP